MSIPADSPEPSPQTTTSLHAATSAAAILTWTSAQLLGQANEARILHGNEVYRLLRTRNQKLILVK
jgi:hemin uptake protein HemP